MRSRTSRARRVTGFEVATGRLIGRWQVAEVFATVSPAMVRPSLAHGRDRAVNPYSGARAGKTNPPFPSTGNDCRAPAITRTSRSQRIGGWPGGSVEIRSELDRSRCGEPRTRGIYSPDCRICGTWLLQPARCFRLPTQTRYRPPSWLDTKTRGGMVERGTEGGRVGGRERGRRKNILSGSCDAQASLCGPRHAPSASNGAPGASLNGGHWRRGAAKQRRVSASVQLGAVGMIMEPTRRHGPTVGERAGG